MEDMRKGIVDLKDFIEATNRVIRQPLYNRIDYADIYSLAVDICKHRRLKMRGG